MSSTTRMPESPGARTPAVVDFGNVVTPTMENSIARRVGNAKRAHADHHGCETVGTLRLAHPTISTRLAVRHRAGVARAVAGLDADIDDGDLAVLDRRHRLHERGGEFLVLGDRTE